MPRQQSLSPTLATAGASDGFRAPKTAELVARTLRQMVVDGQLVDGDFLPLESELMEHFKVSRPTLREAVRVLESERLVEVRRGSRTGARVRVPGPEIVARPAGLLLELAGATLADVMNGRIAIEPLAVNLLAENGTTEAHLELEQLVEAIPSAWEAGQLAHASAHLHRRLVELSGSATLSMIAGMLYEITERHTTAAFLGVHNVVPKAQYSIFIRSCEHLVKLVKARKAAEAEKHWRTHMENARPSLLKGNERTKVRDIMN